MKKLLKHREVWALAILMLLIAAKPWGVTNKLIGLETPKQVEHSFTEDSLLMQPVQIVLPPLAVDTLVRHINEKESAKLKLEKELQDADKELARLEKKRKEKQKAIAKQQENLVSLDEIFEIADRQQKGKGYP